MASSFRLRSGAQAEVDAVFRRHMKAFGKDVERRARRKQAAISDTGAMRASTKVDFGPSGLSLVVSTKRRGRQLKVDVGLIIHQGHTVIRPRTSSYLRFQPKGLRGSGRYVRVARVRAVGGVPYLWNALRDANNALPPGQRFKITRRHPIPQVGGRPPQGASRNP